MNSLVRVLALPATLGLNIPDRLGASSMMSGDAASCTRLDNFHEAHTAKAFYDGR